MENIIAIYIDGVCKANPGEMSIAFIIRFMDGTAFRHHDIIGFGTRNTAIYIAIIGALSFLLKNKIYSKRIFLYTDSQFVVSQISGKVVVTNVKLAELHNKVFELIKELLKFNITVNFILIPKEQNKEVAKLANLAFKR